MEPIVPPRYITKDISLNICHLLFDREQGIDRRVIHSRPSKNFCLDFFKCISPNLTICNIEKPLNFLRKFTPDGKYLICFSKDQQSFESYKFLGTSNAFGMLNEWKTEYVPPDISEGLGFEIRQNIFNKLFKLHWSIRLTSNFMRPLYREFSIFTDDGQYVIIACHTPVPEESMPSYYALGSIGRAHLEYDMFSYRFYIIKLKDGTVSDTIEFPNDYIKLSHNHGVTLRGDLFVVISLFHQSIHVIRLNDGKFGIRYIIGGYPHGSGECICTYVPEYQSCCQSPSDGANDFKQRIVIFLYRRLFILKDTEMIRMFYRKLYIYEAMQLYKLQFLDQDHLLIRYDTHKHPNVKPTEMVRKLYVIYNLPNDEIIKVADENSSDLLLYFVIYCDYFRNVRSNFTGLAPSSSSNSPQIRHAQAKIIRQFSLAAAPQRLLPQIPISVQSFAVTPYLDVQLFQYDASMISSLERPRYSHCQPIRFYDRNTGLLLFRMTLNHFDDDTDEEEDERLLDANAKELVSFVFHPFEPFFISVQKVGTDFVTNFHIRNEATVVKRR